MNLEHIDTIIAFVAIIAGVSMLVTTLTQAVSAFFGLRGSNLRWGVEQLLAHADPLLKEHARAISDQVLHHPLVSDSSMSGMKNGLTARWRLATGIREDELLDVLRALAKDQEGKAEQPWSEALRRSLDVLDRPKVDRLLVVAPAIRKALAEDSDGAEEIIGFLSSRAESFSGEISRWFDPVMVRVSQRFALKARLWTAVFAFVLAFALHLDAFRIFRQLSSDSELRGRVIAGADALLKKADEMQPLGTIPAAAYQEAMTRLIASHAELKALPAPPLLASAAAAHEWLTTQLRTAGVAETDTATWIARYDELVPQSNLRIAAQRLNAAVEDQLRFKLVPDPYPSITTYWQPGWTHFWGTLASAALLSLGAPFWYHVLRDLSSLRPKLAKKDDEEAAAA